MVDPNQKQSSKVANETIHISAKSHRVKMKIIKKMWKSDCGQENSLLNDTEKKTKKWNV